MTAHPPKVSVILVSYGTRDLTLDALASVVRASAEVPLETIVVDNASPDDSADAVSLRYPETTLVRSPQNLGFAAGANRGAGLARGEWLLFLNPDARLMDGSLPALLEAAESATRVGAAGPGIRRPDGRIERSCGRFHSPWRDFVQALSLDRLFPGVPAFEGVFLRRIPARPVPVEWVTGACLLVRREVFTHVGGFDEAFFLYVEDMDLCFRIRKSGYGTLFVPGAVILHEQGQSLGRGSPVLLEGGDAPEYFVWKNGIRYPRPVQRILRILHTGVRVGVLAARALGRDPGARQAELDRFRRSLAALLGLRANPHSAFARAASLRAAARAGTNPPPDPR